MNVAVDRLAGILSVFSRGGNTLFGTCFSRSSESLGLGVSSDLDSPRVSPQAATAVVEKNDQGSSCLRTPSRQSTARLRRLQSSSPL